MSDEWGPWTEHDGKGMPAEVVGRFTHRIHDCGDCLRDGFGISGFAPENWDWSKVGMSVRTGGIATRIIRYRIRKPRGLTILEGLLENLPEEVPA